MPKGLLSLTALTILTLSCTPHAAAPSMANSKSVSKSVSVSVSNSMSVSNSVSNSKSVSNSVSVSNSTSTSSSSSPSSSTSTLPIAPSLSASTIFTKPVSFLSTGEDGRIGLLVDEDGQLVPYRRENANWQRLALPPKEAMASSAFVGGLYFGRDNRPRLMGYRSAPAGIVYLRFRDDAWRPELREIGPLGTDGPAPLFGVLGEADPEVVCRAEDRCLIKSRKGWKEIRPSLPPTALVRSFEGHGYAVTGDGVYRADDTRFVLVGPHGPWKSQPTGFWVGPTESVAVVEPTSGTLYTLDAPSAEWKAELAKVDHPRDVAGPPSDRFLAGAAGLIHGDGSAWSRIGGATGELDRVIVAGWGVVAAGPSGVVEISRPTK